MREKSAARMPCGTHGVVTPYGDCVCEYGWAGDECELDRLQACAQRGHNRSELFRCHGLGSGVSCECLQACSSAGLLENGLALACGKAGCIRDCGPHGICTLDSCACLDGASGNACETVCSNNCLNHCSGNGRCMHGWCRCKKGWGGVDCSRSTDNGATQSTLPVDIGQFGKRFIRTRYDKVPNRIRELAHLLHGAVHVYDLPAEVNRDAKRWMERRWRRPDGSVCDEVHRRRIYSAEAFFYARLLRDELVLSRDPHAAKIHVVPLFLVQRIGWGANAAPPMRRALDYVRNALPFWNRTGGRDHAWFVFGERMTCSIPADIRDVSIIIGHWGDSRCMKENKDIVVPAISPIMHSRRRYEQNVQPFLAGLTCVFARGRRCVEWKPSSNRTQERATSLFFAGGIVSFGASQDNVRRGGRDAASMQTKWLLRVQRDKCALPHVSCPQSYSMGVRQTLWRSKLYAVPGFRVVSAGVDDYLSAVPDSRFCLHAEGNGWGSRMNDYFIMRCVPVLVHTGMIYSFSDLIPYDQVALLVDKREIPSLPKHISRAKKEWKRMLDAAEEHRGAYSWHTPEGTAYEYTIASLGKRFAEHTRRSGMGVQTQR